MRNMMSVLTGVLLTVALTARDSHGAVKNYPLGGQVFEGEVVVNAPPEKVWSVLTNLEQFCGFMDFQFLSGNRQVAVIGDSARMKVWGDQCTYLVTYAEAGRELRLALEPDNASYICQKRWVLSPEGETTRVRLIDRYSESAEQSEESLKAQVKGWERHLAGLREMAEK